MVGLTRPAAWGCRVPKERLQVGDGMLGEMKDGRGERRIGATRSKHLLEMFERAGAAGRDHGNADRVAHGRGQLAVESDLGAVAVDRGQQNLAGASILGLASPANRIARFEGCPAAAENTEAVAVALRVDRHDHGLAAVDIGQRRDDGRVAQRRAVDADFVRARLDRRLRVVERSDPAADGERNEDLSRDGANRVGERAAAFNRRGDVEHHQLVDPFGVVAGRERRGIARFAQPFEVHAFDDRAVADVQTGDQTLGEHVSAPRSRRRRSSPAFEARPCPIFRDGTGCRRRGPARPRPRTARRAWSRQRPPRRAPRRNA